MKSFTQGILFISTIQYIQIQRSNVANETSFYVLCFRHSFLTDLQNNLKTVCPLLWLLFIVGCVISGNKALAFAILCTTHIITSYDNCLWYVVTCPAMHGSQSIVWNAHITSITIGTQVMKAHKTCTWSLSIPAFTYVTLATYIAILRSLPIMVWQLYYWYTFNRFANVVSGPNIEDNHT